MAGVTASIAAFREAYMTVGALDASDFGDFAARRLRYDIFWSFYDNTAYRNLLHAWAQKYKADYGLYRHIRSIYNPSYRLGSFWQAHVFGGLLDPDAGDGKSRPSALPISTDIAPLRPALARLWRDSNWQIRKDILTLRGSLLGDVALRVNDDPVRNKVYLEVVHPRIIKSVALDVFGNVKGYEFEEVRDDPRATNSAAADRDVTYTEACYRDGDQVVYQTFLNGEPFAWNADQGAEWAEPYGFVPLVMIKHNDIGEDWGMSELNAGLPKFREADDLASKANDQIRKMVDSPWLFAGVNKSATTPTATAGTPTPSKPDPGREEIPALYGPAGATATPLVAPLDLTATLAHIKEILSEIERDYPELKADELRLSGALTGRALELAQQPAVDKVLQRRPNYDNAIVRAQQMAIAIGGYRKYEGYGGFDLDSYAAGRLEHSIGERDVFKKSRGDRLEEDNLLYQGASAAVTAGVPLETVLRRDGWSEDDINALYGAIPGQ